MIILIKLSGFLFLLILVLQILMAISGYILEPTPKHYESDAKLISFNEHPKKFQVSVVLALVEHICVITLPITLFIAFNQYNLILGFILIIFRIAEGSIQVYIEKDYWSLLKIAKKYSDTNSTEKDSMFNSYSSILQTKSTRFSFAMIGWSIGTLAFSILLVAYDLAPLYIGWIGIVSTIPVGIGNVMSLVKPKIKFFELLSSIGGILPIIFEVLIGGWLLFFT
ncbi:MAG: DUF4386 family protein [Promethearchaeota archaeon]|jgi:hypothetical protein